MTKAAQHHCWPNSPGFNPQTNIPNLCDRVCLVTGGNSGLGLATTTALAQHNPKKLYVAARSRNKAEDAVALVGASSASAATASIKILDLDLASVESVKKAVARVNEELDRLDLLQLNGGIGMTHPGLTSDGYELQFGTNNMGHVLLTQLLMPKLWATTKLPGADTDIKNHGGPELYAQSMLAKALFAYELAKRYPQITSSSLHPAQSNPVWGGDKDVNWLIANVVVKPMVALTGLSNDERAKTQLWCSFSKEVKNGHYYEPVGKADKESRLARDDGLAARL